ncbi:MAG TPA: hypothetical protein VGG50_02550 [Streptosporangiaceae bacterium]
MATHLACIGLGTGGEQDFQRLVVQANKDAQQQEVIRGVRVRRWEDGSGAAVVLGWRAGQLISFMPALAATSQVRLANCHPVREPVTVADVLDAGGEPVNALAAELEQFRQLVAVGQPVDGMAKIAAFGLSVKLYDDENAFLAAPKGPNDATKPADFEPFGAFTEPAKAQAHARLTGTVLKAERRFSWLTGHPFTVAITRTAGFEVDLCLAGDEHPTVPAPGAIVTGVVSLSISMEHLTG